MIKHKKQVLLTLIPLIIGLIIIFPILYALSLSLMTRAELITYPPKLIPSTPSLANYKQVMQMVPMLTFIRNSFVVAMSVTIGQIIIASLAAFSFVFFDFKGKNLIFILILATMMIPNEAIIISNYLNVSSWGWNDSLKVLIVPYLTSAMGIFLIRQFYLTIPKEIQEAATIDGCGSFQLLTKIIMPISKPAMASLGIYAFINTWNQYLWPLLTINNPEKRTVQIGISMLQFAEGTNYGIVLAGAIIILAPSIIVFAIGQRSLVEGMSTGAVKG